jgi:hypothetical protein
MSGRVLEGRVALVTGASAGLGERFARVLDGAGARVVAVSRRRDRLEALAADLTDPLITAGDLTDASFREEVVEAARGRHGRIDILVNNAGANDIGGGPLDLRPPALP